MNRKLLVGILIALVLGNVGTLIATGVLFPDASTSNSTSTITLNSASGLTAVLSTAVLPRVHHEYKIELSVSMGDCVNPFGNAC